MKKFILPIVLLTLGWATAQAQTFNLGVKAGVNLAKLNADFASEENRLGYQVGAWARIGGASFYVQPEAYIGSKGNKFISFTNNNNKGGCRRQSKVHHLRCSGAIGNEIRR